MVDENKEIVLIDFDRMIEDDKEEMQTIDLSSNFIAPEIGEGESYKSSDIYSIGQIIYFLFIEENLLDETNTNFDDQEIQNIYLKCTKENQKKLKNKVRINH